MKGKKRSEETKRGKKKANQGPKPNSKVLKTPGEGYQHKGEGRNPLGKQNAEGPTKTGQKATAGPGKKTKWEQRETIIMAKQYPEKAGFKKGQRLFMVSKLGLPGFFLPRFNKWFRSTSNKTEQAPAGFHVR